MRGVFGRSGGAVGDGRPYRSNSEACTRKYDNTTSALSLRVALLGSASGVADHIDEVVVVVVVGFGSPDPSGLRKRKNGHPRGGDNAIWN